MVGDVITAEAIEVHAHHRLPYMEVKVCNQRGELVCALTAHGYRKDKMLEMDL